MITESMMKTEVYHNGVIVRLCDLACDSLVNTDELTYLVVCKEWDTATAIKYLKGGKTYREHIATRETDPGMGSALDEVRTQDGKTEAVLCGRGAPYTPPNVRKVRHKVLHTMESPLRARLDARAGGGGF